MDYPKAPAGSAAEATFRSLQRLGIEYAGATAEGGRFRCPNPGHEDERASCDVTIGRKGKPLFNCKPCEQAMGQAEYIDALRSHGVNWHGEPCKVEDVDWGAPAVIRQISVAGRGKSGDVRLSAVYTYSHADGTPNFKVKRYDPTEGSTVSKQFRPQRYVKGEGWVTGLEGTERTPYHLERFEEWAGGVLYLVEGEKACDALVEVGRAATTFHGGAAGKVEDDWPTRYGFDRFAQVRVWPDADEAGVKRALALCSALVDAGVRAVVWGVPAGKLMPKDDAFDVLKRGLTKEGHVLSEPELEALATLHPLPVRQNAQKRPVERVEVAGKVLVSAEPYGAADGGTEPARRPEYPVALNVEPYKFTKELIQREFRRGDVLTLHLHHDGAFWLWSDDDSRYEVLSEVELKAIVSELIDGEDECTPDGEVRPIKVTDRAVTEVLKHLKTLTLASKHAAGVLLPSRGGVPFRNGWLEVETGKLHAVGPERDVRWNVPLDYDPNGGGSIEAWNAFLDSIGWGPGTEEYRLLRQWFGYVLSGSKVHQKALVLVGPTRSGKGTILEVAAAMLGDGAVGTQMDMLADKNGLENLVGKGLVTVGDARLSFKTDKGLVGKLLSLTGDDPMTINAKYKNLISERLDCRLMLATNELPTFTEASDALARRFIVLQMQKSFLGHEDLYLRSRLRGELPGIVAWALEGYRELQGLGSFSQTTQGRDLQEQMVKDAAPIRVFIEEECEFGETLFVEKQVLYDEYVLWTRQNGIAFVLSKPQFFRDLNTAFPGMTKSYAPRKAGKPVKAILGMRLRK